MFTAEELENCDIFPKKITLICVLKFLIYFAIMFTGFLFIISLYTGRDIKHLFSFDTLKYGPNSELFEQLYSLDSKFNYNLQEKYNFDFQNAEAANFFMQEYVSQSVPCIVKNLSLELPAYKLWTNNNINVNEINEEKKDEEMKINYKEILNTQKNSEFKFVENKSNNNSEKDNKFNSTEKLLNPFRLAKLSEAFGNFEFVVEVKSDPLANFFGSSSDFSFERLNYLNFYEKATDPQRMKNYFINNHLIPESAHKFIFEANNYNNNKNKEINDEKEKNNNINTNNYTNNEENKNNFFKFTKHLEFKNIKYSEGFGESITPAHYEKEEQLFCELTGSIDIIIIPQLYRNTVYPFKKGFGPADYSPINFFESEFGRFPKFAKAHRLLITLNQEDCLYIPAYWWFSVRTAKQSHFMFVTVNYNSHSHLLDYLIRNIEKEEI